MPKPRIAIPLPHSTDLEYSRRAWPEYASAIERSGAEPVEVPLNQLPADTAKLLSTCQAILLPGSGADVNPQKYGQQPDPETAPPDPARENVDELLLQDAHNMGKPIFTICFGTQMLNVWRGGTLIQHLNGMPVNHKAGRAVGIAHTAAIAADSLLGELAQAELSTPAPETEEGPERAASEIGRDFSPGTNSPGLSRALAPGTCSSTEMPQNPDFRASCHPEAGFLRLPVNSSHHQAIGIPGDGLRVTARSPEDGVVEAVENTPDAVGGPFVLGVQWHPERTFDQSAASRALFSRFVAEAAAWAPKPSTPSGESSTQ
ncbi:MAG TPA: gamma-glutamyl-gamma-aminobutyrate hydrolase family protein [Acidobacteriaceae bacterium]|nr:gamma-glutamyl-gamma-aminobutyrate hydrolase family protein [Acidobacteriaceae bacterium]